MTFSAKVEARAKSPTFAKPKSGNDIRTYGKPFAHTLSKRLLRRLGKGFREGRRGGTAM